MKEYIDSLTPHSLKVLDKLQSFCDILPIKIKPIITEKSINFYYDSKLRITIPLTEDIHPSDYCDLLEIAVKRYYPRWFETVESNLQFEIEEILDKSLSEVVGGRHTKVQAFVERIHLKVDKFKVKICKTPAHTEVRISKVPLSTLLGSFKTLKGDTLREFINTNSRKLVTLFDKKVPINFESYSRNQIVNFRIINHFRPKFEFDRNNSTTKWCDSHILNEDDIVKHYKIKYKELNNSNVSKKDK